MRRLPPFFALRALETAARHRSYTRAADELSVTHGAVSHQIRRLEAELRTRLFERRGNAMEPTAAALRLAAEVGRGLDVMQDAVAQFTAGAERDPLVMSLDPQFGGRWLSSRLEKLLAQRVGATLEIRAEERFADFTTDGVDIAVRYGAGCWDGVESRLLFTERLLPVCSPQVAARHPMRRPADLLTAPLLHHGHRPWNLWFSAFQLKPPPRKGPLFGDSVMLLEAAAQGLGVALARSGLVEADLAAGRLVPLLPDAIDSEFGFFIVWRAESRKIARIHSLRDWLVAEAAITREQAPPHHPDSIAPTSCPERAFPTAATAAKVGA